VQTYYIERPGPNVIFAAATPTRLYFEDRAIFQLPDGSLRAGVKIGADSVYTVVSQRRLATAAALRASPANAVPPALRDLYARPPATTARVRALAQQVTASAPTVYDKVLALEAWTGAHTKYTLDIPALPKGRDAVDQFLFVDRRGFCEQIGTSLVVMLRALGIPARLAVGYASGERNPFTGLYEVRAKDAHAWAEVYFPGVGWQGFDPTASVPLAGDSAIDGAGTGALAYLNAHVSIPTWVPTLIMGLAVIAGLLTLGTWVARRARRPRRPAPSWAATRLGRLERLGRRRDRPREPGETLPEYAAALARVDPFAASSLDAVGHGIDQGMFSGDEPSAHDRRAIDDTLDALDERWSRTSARDHALAPV
jgi:transglutaminase-like putative cysteine protease